MELKYPTNYIGITKGFRPKKYPTHSAIDLGWNNKYGGKNVPVYACGDGVVTSIRDGRNNTMLIGDSGNYVTVKYSDGYETRVCHLQKGTIRVKKGTKVTSDTVLGKMGNSGYCGIKKGNHVHFIVWKNGKRVNPIYNTYVYPDQVVASSTKKEYTLLYYDEKKHTYIQITAKNGIWCRKGIGYKYPKYKAIPYGTKCELLQKDCGKANGYEWWKIIYNNEEVYIPYKNTWVEEI